MNLYELKTAYANIQDLIEQGEDLEGVLETIDGAIEEKADNYAKVMANMNATIEGLKSEEKRLKKKRDALENGVTKLKENLFNAMVECKKKEFKTDLFSFNIQKNGGKTPIILKVECSELPDELVTVTEKPNLEALAKHIEETGDVTYAEFGERGESLRIK